MSDEKKSSASSSPSDLTHPFEPVKAKLAHAVVIAFNEAFQKDIAQEEAAILARFEKPKAEHGEITLPCFTLGAYLKPAKMNPMELVKKLAEALQKQVADGSLPEVESFECAGAYINFFLTPRYLGQVLDAILSGSFLAPRSSAGKDRVMIEYSQPNTHKAFHVGHMRNAALGDFLVRTWSALGHPVIAANYFGDEGAHVAKCLWWLKKEFLKDHPNSYIEQLPKPWGENLGLYYQGAVEALDMSTATAYPYPGLVCAQVVSKTKHPNPQAPPNWHVVEVKTGEAPEQLFTVVCGGHSYEVGDKVAFVPPGSKFGNKTITPMDKDGVMSSGMIVARKEVDLPDEEKKEEPKKKDGADKSKAPKEKQEKPAKEDKPKEPKAPKEKQEKPAKPAKDAKDAAAAPSAESSGAAAPAAEAPKEKESKKDKKDRKQKENAEATAAAAAAAGTEEKSEKPAKKEQQPKDKKGDSEKKEQAPKDGGKGGKKEEKKGPAAGGDKSQANPSNKIFVLPADMPVGAVLTEFGRYPAQHVVPANSTVDAEFEKRNKEVRDALVAMEAKEPQITELWDITKRMSLNEFHEIYTWLDSTFHHNFYESDMTEPSKKMVLDFFARGLLVKDNGAVGADLKAHGLGFLVLLKSDGSTLYATKDLALAVKKFDEFNIDRSIYVVDAAQSMHFAQVFKTLELMGYERAKKCYHLPYGLVVLKEGRMSSRHGTIVYFSKLRNELYKTIHREYLSEKVSKEGWTEQEVEEAQHAISLASIKYGMLNTDSAKDIVFELDEWTSPKGNTGPYLLYAYTRINKILRDVPYPADAKVDFAHLTHPLERKIMTHLAGYWQAVESAAFGYNSSPLCVFIYELAKTLSVWYEVPSSNVKKEKDPHVQATRLKFLQAVADALKSLLLLLGIKVVPRM